MCHVAFPRETGFSFPQRLQKPREKKALPLFPRAGEEGDGNESRPVQHLLAKSLRGSRQGGFSLLLFCKSSAFFHGEKFEGKVESQGCDFLHGTCEVLWE